MQDLIQSAASYGHGQTILTKKQLLTTERLLGRGSFGTVYEAKHAQWGTVAYKRLNTIDGFVEQSCLMSVIKEVQAHSQLRHPNITQMMGVVCEPNIELGIVLWYEQYGDAFSFVNTFRVDWAFKVELMYHVSLGLTYLHTSNPAFIHGDIKIHNVLIGDGFVAKLSDFGLSNWRDYSTARSHVSSKGTTTHIPPERLRAINVRRNEKTDMYSYGVLVWELLTGKLPFPDSPEALIIDAVRSGSRPDRDDIPIDVPTPVRDVMEVCWVDQPAARPSSSEIAKKLEALRTEYRRMIEKCRYDLCTQDSRRRMSGSNNPSGENWPIETESRGSWTSPGVDVPRGSNPTNPLAAKQVMDSPSFNSYSIYPPTSVQPENNQSQRHMADNRSVRFSASDIGGTQPHIPQAFSRGSVPGVLLRGQHSTPTVGLAARLSSNRQPLGPPPPVAPKDTMRSLSSTASLAEANPGSQAPASPAAAAAPLAAANSRNSTVVTSGSLESDDDDELVEQKKKRKRKLRKTDVAGSIGRPCNFRHLVHIGADPRNGGIYASNGTIEVDRSLVVGNSQLDRTGGTDDILADDFELVRITRPRSNASHSTMSSSTYRYSGRHQRTISDSDSALEY